MEFNTSEQNIGWIRDRYLEGSLILGPVYQRNSVWKSLQKQRLVESVLLKMPIPELFIQQVTDENGKTEYAVVDGQQRVTSILQFLGAYDAENQDSDDKFSLELIPSDSEFYGKSFEDLSPEKRASFFGYKFSVRYLNSAKETDMREVFNRLNANSASLTEQEIRNATYIGSFAEFVREKTDKHGDFLASRSIITASKIRRMGDIEFIADLTGSIMLGIQAGNKRAIDGYYSAYESYDELPNKEEIGFLLDETFSRLKIILDESHQKRWKNKTDFYSLFMVIAENLKDESLIRTSQMSEICEKLDEFAEKITYKMAHRDEDGEDLVEIYIENVSKGASDKSRRVARHRVLKEVLGL